MQYLWPDWPLPAGVRSFVTLAGDFQQSIYGTGNLGLHVEDSPPSVLNNRQVLAVDMGWRRSPVWLKQVHGNQTLTLTPDCDALKNQAAEATADAVYTNMLKVPCVVLTADCLPILVYSRVTQEVAAIHAGWRGLVAGVIESALSNFNAPSQELSVWLGPAIGPDYFEVGGEVRQCFLHQYAYLTPVFKAQTVHELADKWLMDIYAAAKLIIQSCGVSEIHGGGFCTYSDDRFYSYRRGGLTGRFATGIWIDRG